MLLITFKHEVFVLWLLIFMAWSISMSNCAKILGLFPHSSESHFIVMRTFVMELARRNHNVTIYTAHRLDETVDNLEQFIIEPEFSYWREVHIQAGLKGEVETLSRISEHVLENALSKAGYRLGFNYFSHPHIQKLLQLSAAEFDYDLVVLDLFYTEALLAVGYHFHKPTLAILSTDFANYMEQVQENIVPSACLPYSDQQSNINLPYWKRVTYIWQCFNRRKHFRRTNYGYQEDLIRNFFTLSSTANYTILQLQKHLSLMLINNYMPLVESKPLLPNMVLVGGLQVGGARDLPWHIKRFLDEARNGAIYMNLGDHHLCSTLSQNKLDVLLHTFTKIEISIIWTCHGGHSNIKSLPKNVLIQHGVAQTDILAHPHIKVFITNGDLISMQDAIMRMVKILALPLFSNEHQNCHLIKQLQVGLCLPYSNLEMLTLEWTIGELLYNDLYVLNIRNVSKIFRDRPLGGLYTAMFWLDYILKYDSNYLHTKTVGIPLNQLHLFDFIALYFFMLLVIVSVILLLLYFIVFVWKKQKYEKLFSKLN